MDRYAVIEGVFRNVGCIQGNPDLFERTEAEGGIADSFQIRIYSVIERQIFKPRTREKRTRADFADVAGKIDVFDCRVSKCLSSDNLHVVSQTDFGKIFAVCERIASDFRDAIGNDDGLDSRSEKRALADFFDGIGNIYYS